MCNHYKAGMLVNDIALEVRRPHNTVWKILWAYGLPQKRIIKEMDNGNNTNS